MSVQAAIDRERDALEITGVGEIVQIATVRRC